MKDTFNLVRKFQKYEVSKEGVVRDVITQKELPRINITKDAMVILRQDNRIRLVSIAQLVAETHLDMWFQMSRGGWGLKHKDGNRKNNNVNNIDCYRLEFEEKEENKLHELIDFIMT